MSGNDTGEIEREKDRERERERDRVVVMKVSLFLMGTAALYRVCSTGLR